jgi:hypothetical protein
MIVARMKIFGFALIGLMALNPFDAAAQVPLYISNPEKSADSSDDEVRLRSQSQMDINNIFMGNNYDKLELIYSSYLSSKTRTGSGLWMLEMFHIALEQPYIDTYEKNEISNRFFQTFLGRWLAKYPNSEAAHIAQANNSYQRAWNLALQSRSGPLTDSEKRLVTHYIGEAQSYLKHHRPTDTQNPYWDLLHLRLATLVGEERKNFDQILNSALDRVPNFYPLYFAAVSYYASYSEDPALDIDRLAQLAIERSRKTDGDGMYARIYWLANDWAFGDQIFSSPHFKWPLMKKGMDDVLTRWPSDWNRSKFAYYACLMRDKPQTAKLVRDIKDPYRNEFWSREGSFNRCKSWALE